MARTFGALLFYNATQISATSGGVLPTTQSVYTRNAAGDYSWNQIASQTVQYQCGIADVKRPYITFPAPAGVGTLPLSNEFKEMFGTAAGGPGNPFSGGQTGIQFETAAFPYGLAVIDVFAIYSVGTNPLSAGSTISLFRQRYAEGVANAQDTLVNAVAVTLTTTASATTCHVFKSSLAQPLVFESTDNSDLVLELALVTPAGGTARVYGIGVHAAVEYS